MVLGFSVSCNYDLKRSMLKEWPNVLVCFENSLPSERLKDQIYTDWVYTTRIIICSMVSQ